MNFTDLPEELVKDHILPYLRWNDLLRLRRINKSFKRITHSYLQDNPQLAPEIEIDERDKSIPAFLRIGLPTSKLFLNNLSGHQFYTNFEDDLEKLLETFGRHVRSLRLDQMSMHICFKEWDFLDSLENLRNLEVHQFEVNSERQRLAQRDARYAEQSAVNEMPVPQVFNDLQVLKIGKRENSQLTNVIYKIPALLYAGLNLKYASLPFDIHTSPDARSVPEDTRNRVLKDARLSLVVAFRAIHACIQEPVLRPTNIKLKCFDFENFYDAGSNMAQVLEMVIGASSTFLELCRLCLEKDIKLRNVHPYWFFMRFEATVANSLKSPQLGIPIVSLLDLHPCVFPLEMPNLERIEIKATSKSSVGRLWREQRPLWGTLKELDITVDSRHAEPFYCYQPTADSIAVAKTDTNCLFNFFFQDIRRTNLTELRLHFVKNAVDVSTPSTKDIAAACPNLRKLTLVKWPGTSLALTKLWEGITGLEELSLEYCEGLGNEAFFGKVVRNPVFLKLKKLRKFSLKGLDKMPKLTDTVFLLVFRHIPLTHFTLTADEPLKTVTLKGICSMLGGKFAETIEKFPFKDWSLKGVSREEFKEVEKKFRSYDMI